MIFDGIATTPTLMASTLGSSIVESIDSKIKNIEQLSGNDTSNARNKKELQTKKESIRSLATILDKQLADCQESKISTDTHCMESNNKEMNQFMSTVGSVSDMTGMAMSASCSKLANLMHMGQAAQAAFRTNCGFQKSNCVDKCTEAEKTLSKISFEYDSISRVIVKSPSSKYDLDHITNCTEFSNDGAESYKKYSFIENPSPTDTHNSFEECNNAKLKEEAKIKANEDLDNSFRDGKSKITEAMIDPNSPAALKRSCINTQQEVTAKVGMNLMSLMSAMQKNTMCAKQLKGLADTGLGVDDCILKGTCPPPQAAPDVCKDPQYKDSNFCKPVAGMNGDTKGFNNLGGGAVPPIGGPPNLDLGSKSLSDLDLSGGGNPLDPNDPNSALNKIGDSPTSKSAGVPNGGGGGGLNLPGGGGGGGPNPRGGARGLSSDSISPTGSPSYSGGGGGMGGFGNSNDKKDNLQQYLPGGSKDPQLTKNVSIEGITSPSGLTLFEKVSRGYKNTRSSLIPE